MKKLEDICVSLESAKELEKAGFSQNSIFYWIRLEDQEEFSLVKKKTVNIVMSDFEEGDEVYSAYTVGELGEFLPSQVFKNNHIYNLEIEGGCRNFWSVGYREPSHYYDFEPLIEFMAISEITAKTWMCIYLKKEGLI